MTKEVQIININIRLDFASISIKKKETLIGFVINETGKKPLRVSSNNLPEIDSAYRVIAQQLHSPREYTSSAGDNLLTK